MKRVICVTLAICLIFIEYSYVQTENNLEKAKGSKGVDVQTHQGTQDPEKINKDKPLDKPKENDKENIKPMAIGGKYKDSEETKANKKFPWLLVGGILVVGAIVAVLLLSKKKGSPSQPTSQYVFVTTWGSGGSGDGQFIGPTGIAVDSSGNVYVTDGNCRIQKFTSEGSFITKWGSPGSGDGQFNPPARIAVDSSGYVYVTDTNNHRIQKFTSAGSFITKWGSNGSGDGQFIFPYGIAVDSAGNVYITDVSTHRIQKFTSEGNFILAWGGGGSGDGQFSGPYGIAVDSSGNVYVIDGNCRIQKFTSGGSFITKWGSWGSGNGQFSLPYGIAIDSAGNVYITDVSTNRSDLSHDRIQKFTSGGSFITKWGSPGSGDGQFIAPTGIAVDSSGNVYVTDNGNHRVQKFRQK